MYVCVCVCMHVCMYVLYVCKFVRLYVCMCVSRVYDRMRVCVCVCARMCVTLSNARLALKPPQGGTSTATEQQISVNRKTLPYQ